MNDIGVKMKTASLAFFSAMLVAVFAAPAFAQPAAQSGETAPEVEVEIDETREEALDRLHTELAAETDPEAAKALADQIQRLWSRSGSDSMDLLLTRARGALQREDFDSARRHIAALNRLAPDFAEGWNAAATLFYLQEDLGASMARIERVVALEPRHFSALTGLAFIMERIDKPDEAMAVWRKVEELYPGFETAKTAIERLELEVDGRSL